MIFIFTGGKPLFKVKQAAIEQCAENNIGVVLVSPRQRICTMSVRFSDSD
ncbi:MAG: hypothetical protein R2941_14200 [Desulfobacterales bacterium]